jgi:hypothetical protein
LRRPGSQACFRGVVSAEVVPVWEASRSTGHHKKKPTYIYTYRYPPAPLGASRLRSIILCLIQQECLSCLILQECLSCILYSVSCLLCPVSCEAVVLDGSCVNPRSPTLPPNGCVIGPVASQPASQPASPAQPASQPASTASQPAGKPASQQASKPASQQPGGGRRHGRSL